MTCVPDKCRKGKNEDEVTRNRLPNDLPPGGELTRAMGKLRIT